MITFNESLRRGIYCLPADITLSGEGRGKDPSKFEFQSLQDIQLIDNEFWEGRCNCPLPPGIYPTEFLEYFYLNRASINDLHLRQSIIFTSNKAQFISSTNCKVSGYYVTTHATLCVVFNHSIDVYSLASYICIVFKQCRLFSLQ